MYLGSVSSIGTNSEDASAKPPSNWAWYATQCQVFHKGTSYIHTSNTGLFAIKAFFCALTTWPAVESGNVKVTSQNLSSLTYHTTMMQRSELSNKFYLFPQFLTERILQQMILGSPPIVPVPQLDRFPREEANLRAFLYDREVEDHASDPGQLSPPLVLMVKVDVLNLHMFWSLFRILGGQLIYKDESP